MFGYFFFTMNTKSSNYCVVILLVASKLSDPTVIL